MTRSRGNPGSGFRVMPGESGAFSKAETRFLLRYCGLLDRPLSRVPTRSRESSFASDMLGIIQGLWLLPRMRGGRPYPHPPIQAVEQVAPAASSLRSRGYSACLNCGHTQLRSHSRRSHSSGHNRHDLGILEGRTGTDAARLDTAFAAITRQMTHGSQSDPVAA